MWHARNISEINRYLWKHLNEIKRLEDLGEEENIVLIWSLNMSTASQLAQNGNKRQADIGGLRGY
jgi:hypothetical protein